MDNQVEIKAINPSVKSMKLTVPYDGTIEINADGIAIVSERAAEVLVNSTSDWKYLKENKPQSDDKSDANNAEKSEDEQVVAGIKKMKLTEMIDMATAAGYPESEWSRFAKKEKLMAAYLIKKYNEIKLEEEKDDTETAE